VGSTTALPAPVLLPVLMQILDALLPVLLLSADADAVADTCASPADADAAPNAECQCCCWYFVNGAGDNISKQSIPLPSSPLRVGMRPPLLWRSGPPTLLGLGIGVRVGS
jgi:hypothetical protein